MYKTFFFIFVYFLFSSGMKSQDITKIIQNNIYKDSCILRTQDYDRVINDFVGIVEYNGIFYNE